MQAGKTKTERAVSKAVRAAARPYQRKERKVARKAAREAKRIDAASWESVAKIYASPKHIAKTRAIHKQQCESLAASKIS